MRNLFYFKKLAIFSEVALKTRLGFLEPPYIIKEVENVFLEKFPHRINEMKRFMGRISYELFEVKEKTKTTYPEIRDIDDFPVLVNAIESNVDVLITGDKDFDEISLKKPIIMKPRKFIDEYMGGSTAPGR